MILKILTDQVLEYMLELIALVAQHKVNLVCATVEETCPDVWTFSLTYNWKDKNAN